MESSFIRFISFSLIIHIAILYSFFNEQSIASNTQQQKEIVLSLNLVPSIDTKLITQSKIEKKEVKKIQKKIEPIVTTKKSPVLIQQAKIKPLEKKPEDKNAEVKKKTVKNPIAKKRVTKNPKQATKKKTISKPVALSSIKKRKINSFAKMELNNKKRMTAESEYRSQVIQKIENNKFYPKRIKRLGKEGDVAIEFTLDRNGRIVSVNVIDVIGPSAFKKAALKAIRLSSLFPPFPDLSSRQEWSFKTSLKYRLK